MTNEEATIRILELRRLLADLDWRGSFGLLGFGARGYLTRVVEARISEIKQCCLPDIVGAIE
jgi:hypothetical protein